MTGRLLPVAVALLISAPSSGAEIAYDLRALPLQGLPSSMAALILSGQGGGEVLFSALALPLGPLSGPVPPAADAAEGDGEEGGEPRHLVALLLEVEGASFLGDAPPEVVTLEFYAYALTPEARVSGFLSQEVSLDVETFGEAVATGGVKLFTHLELPAGRHELRLLVRESASGRFGLQAVEVEVPGPPPGGAPLLSPPLVEEPEAPWVLVAEAPDAGGRAVDFSALLARAGLPVPSALPVVGGDAAELHVLLYQAGANGVPGALRMRLRNLEDGATVDLPATVVESSETGIEGVHRLRLETPLDVDTGSYFVRLAARSDDLEVESPELGIVVLRRSAAGSQVWTDVQRRIRGEPPRAELELGATRRRRARDRQLRRAGSRAYRTVLQRLASGDRDGALEDLLRIELQAIDEAEGDFPLLREVETAVVEALAAADPEALVPVARLHHEAYRRSREEHRFGLAAHSRSMATAVAERYAAAGGEGAAEIGSDLVALVGDDLQQARVYRSARDHLRRALALDPTNAHALLQLAVGLERAGDYARTTQLLEELVEADPKAPEARLRLGINLLRLGRSERGREVLGRLVREHNPDWVLAVAFEELAMDRLREGDLEGAVRLLRQGLGRLPGEGRLAIQLAYALDRTGRRQAARVALDRLSAAAASEPSPRHLYCLWPPGDRDEIDASLARAAMLRLPALGSALASGGGGEARR